MGGSAIRIHKKTKAEALATVRPHPVSAVAGAVFLLASAGLAFQIALTRLFSLLFQYHYVFLVVSLAVLGLGIGAAAGYVAQRRRAVRESNRPLTSGALALAVAFPATAWLLARAGSAGLTAFAALVALVPFMCIGWVNALVYARFSSQSGLIYGADLLGAALGPVIALILLVLLGPVGMAIALGVFAALAALLLGQHTSALRIAGALALALIVLTLANRAAGFLDYSPVSVTSAPPDKTMVHFLKDNPDAAIIATRWSPFAQIDVAATQDNAVRYVFTDAGAGSVMLRYNHDNPDENDTAWVDSEAASLPFSAGPLDTVLVIGAGAGYDVFLANHAGAQSITAVEINPAMVVITEQMADFNGGILNLPNVRTVVTDGRNFADRETQNAGTYDLVYLNLVYSQAATPGTSALVENNAFTVEALRSYWRLLDEDGRLAFVLHNGLEGARLLVTALRSLEEEGIPLRDALVHVGLVMASNSDDPDVTPSVLIVKRRSWEQGDARSFALGAARRGMQPLYIPHEAPEALKVLADGSMTLDQYIAASADYDISPTTDNRPFFYHMDPGLPPALRTLLIFSALAASGYFLVTAALHPKNVAGEWTRMSLALYFGLLGVGFMLVEIAALQRFGLLLGDPALSLAVTLGALLLGAGLGSLLSRRFKKGRAAAWAALAIGAAVVISIVVYPRIVHVALPASLAARVAVAIVALLPLGFLMGMPFPLGLRTAGKADPGGVPLYWGMNAVASTFGASLATTLAMLAGYHAALMVGAVVYLVGASLVWFTWARTAG